MSVIEHTYIYEPYIHIIYIIYIYIYTHTHTHIYLYSEDMKTTQCAHPHYHNGFVVTCQLWMASGGVHTLLVLEPTECSANTKQGA